MQLKSLVAFKVPIRYARFILTVLLHSGSLLLQHVLKCAMDDGNIDNIYL